MDKCMSRPSSLTTDGGGPATDAFLSTVSSAFVNGTAFGPRWLCGEDSADNKLVGEGGAIFASAADFVDLASGASRTDAGSIPLSPVQVSVTEQYEHTTILAFKAANLKTEA